MKKPGPSCGGPGLKFVSWSSTAAAQEQAEGAEAQQRDGGWLGDYFFELEPGQDAVSADIRIGH